MMSVDVFGRHFKRGVKSTIGPPGVGFKMTADGQYNIDGKRLCNVSEAEDQSDAVNLSIVHRIILHETNAVYQVIASLRTEVVNNNMMIEVLEGSMNRNVKNLQAVADSRQEVVYQNSKFIHELDTRLSALENAGGKASSSGRAS